MHYFIGLDNGGTTTKAALYDVNGRELAVCRSNTAVMTPAPGFAERDMEEMWQANCAVIRGVLEMAGADASDVAGVAVCGHGKGLYRPARLGLSGKMAGGRHGGAGLRPLLPAYHGLPAGGAAGVAPGQRA